MKAPRPVNMDYEVWQAIEKMAKQKNISISRVVEEILKRDEKVKELMKKVKE